MAILGRSSGGQGGARPPVGGLPPLSPNENLLVSVTGQKFTHYKKLMLVSCQKLHVALFLFGLVSVEADDFLFN